MAGEETRDSPPRRLVELHDYRPLPRVDTLIVHATVLDGAGQRHDDADLLMVDGKIAALGRSLTPPTGAEVIEAAGAWVTPGVIDPHCHLGDFPAPYVSGAQRSSDVNEDSDPNTADVRAEDSITVQDPAFSRALAGGVTTAHVLPGSINLFAGQSVIVKTAPATTGQAMVFPGSTRGVKMSCGENPKHFYGEKGRFPSSRMGAVAGQRAVWLAARDYDRAWQAYRDHGADRPPERNPKLDALTGVLRGENRVHIHCYRADDMATMLGLASECGFAVAAFHHAVEGYKIADLLSRAGVAAVVWSDWWGFKEEAFDAIRENAAFLDAAGVCVALHSDSWVTGQRLTVEAGKAMAAGRHAGLEIAPERAIGWVTANPARILGLADQVGSLEIGMNADVAVWSGDPFSIYSQAQKVFIDGALVFDRGDPGRQPLSDFELGQPTCAVRR